MKRSEVLNVIADYFYECNVDGPDADTKADKLLSKLEEMGMLPPEYRTKAIEGIDYDNICDGLDSFKVVFDNSQIGENESVFGRISHFEKSVNEWETEMPDLPVEVFFEEQE